MKNLRSDEHPDFQESWRRHNAYTLLMAKKLGKRFGDEPHQALGLMALVMNHLLHAFDPSRGVKFLTFYARYAPKFYYSTWKQYESEADCNNAFVKRRRSGEPFHDVRAVNPEDLVVKPDEISEVQEVLGWFKGCFWKSITEGLDEKEALAVCWYYRDGERQQEIGTRLGKSRQNADLMIHRAIKKIRRRLREDKKYTGIFERGKIE